jgi:hypothetical protein
VSSFAQNPDIPAHAAPSRQHSESTHTSKRIEKARRVDQTNAKMCLYLILATSTTFADLFSAAWSNDEFDDDINDDLEFGQRDRPRRWIAASVCAPTCCAIAAVLDTPYLMLMCS